MTELRSVSTLEVPLLEMISTLVSQSLSGAPLDTGRF